MLKNFRTFHDSVAFYRQVAGLRMPTHLKSQLLRASSSICLNLAEGRGKTATRDQRRFFDIAMGSMRESQAVLLLASDLDPSLSTNADRLAASLFLLIRHAKK